MNEAVRAENLTKFYGELCAVDHISFEVEKGEIFGFLGPNGAGKTTTVRMLTGISIPTEGTAEIMGYDIQRHSVEAKELMGIVPDISNVYNELSAWDNLTFTGKLYNMTKAHRESRATELLELFDLFDRRHEKLGTYSRGMKRRVCIAMALINRSAILFLDEPTSGLDVQSVLAIRKMIRKLNEDGLTIFLTTHYIEEADQLCDRIAIIVKGRIIALDTPEHLKAVVQGTSVIEVSFTSPVESINLEELETYGQVKSKDNTVWIQVTGVSTPLKALTRFADDHGLDVVYLNTVKPSLEDAFVQLTGVESEVMLMEKERRGGGV